LPLACGIEETTEHASPTIQKLCAASGAPEKTITGEARTGDLASMKVRAARAPSGIPFCDRPTCRIDKLALEEAGIRNVVSVPAGAPKALKSGAPDPADAKFEYLANCAAYLEPLERIVLAVDADGPGQALEEELARRLGRERCWRVRWPDSGDAP